MRSEFAHNRRTLPQSGRWDRHSDGGACHPAANGFAEALSFRAPRILCGIKWPGIFGMRDTALAVVAGSRRDRGERTYVIHVSAQGCVVSKLQSELNGGDNRRCRHIAEGI